MKKLLCIFLALLMVVSVALVACKDDEEPETPDDDLGFDDITPADSSSDTSDTTEPVVTEPITYEFETVDETVYVQNCVKVNIRSTPTTAGDNVVGSIDFGAQYKRVKKNDVWSGIEVNGETFYVNTYFLTNKPDEVVFEMKEGIPSVIYAVNINEAGEAGNINLRTFTSTFPDSSFHPNGNIGTSVKHGAPLNVTGISADGHWYRVDFTYTDDNGQSKTINNLYVYNGKYVSETAPAAAQ